MQLHAKSSMFKCPHCNQKSISFAQKFNLVLNSRNKDYRCKKCGKLVTVSFGSILLLLPVTVILLMIIYFNYLDFLHSNFIGAMVLFFGTVSVITFLVPLKKLK
jgi:predicted RNA-binding Zn-ribbon protein involved in translation (DUF1610 family)